MKVISRQKRFIKRAVCVLLIVSLFLGVFESTSINSYADNGWNYDSTGWWYLRPDGSYPYDGWELINGKYYLFDWDGYMLTGWQEKDGYYYYLGTDGAMRTDEWIGLNYVNSDGVWQSGKCDTTTNWVKIDGKYFNIENGEKITGWLQASGENWYYLYTEDDVKDGGRAAGHQVGEMASDTYIDGYYIAPDGLTNASYSYAKEVLDSVGWNLYAAYTWANSLEYSGREVYGEDWGSTSLAVQGFKNKTGNCYVKASVFYQMAKILGYDAHQMCGYVKNSSGGLSRHSWVEIDYSDGIWCYDINHGDYEFTYGTSGTYIFSNYYRMN